jgi:2-keto-4-pentenoate hydratase/2-oxohepta-3-ene-1,7-dioic acid hydratase in catechol pathway
MAADHRSEVKAFCPFGPVMVTPQMLPDPGELSVKAVINGVEREIKAQGANLNQVQE